MILRWVGRSNGTPGELSCGRCWRPASLCLDFTPDEILPPSSVGPASIQLSARKGPVIVTKIEFHEVHLSR